MITIAYFSMKALKARKICRNAFQILKDSGSLPKLIYPAKLHVIIEEKKKNVPLFKKPKKKTYFQQSKHHENIGRNMN